MIQRKQNILRKPILQISVLAVSPQDVPRNTNGQPISSFSLRESIVNREEGLEAGGVSDNMLKFWSRDNTSALESRLVIRAVQKIKLCLAKRLVFLPRSRKS